jgi:hypothetical protein
MATYLRRVVVLEQYAPQVVNYIKENVTQQLMTDTIKINKRDYRIIRFVASAPFIMRLGNIQISRNGIKPVPKAFIDRVVASDLDLGSLIVDQSDYVGLSVATAGTFNVTISVTDPDGVASTLEFPVAVVDTTIPVITLLNSGADIPLADVATWDPADTIVSAVDDGDDVSGDVIITFKIAVLDEFTDTLADLAAARTHLGTIGNAVGAFYNYSDASANAAEQKLAVFVTVE